jgi:hypothetical protein
MMTLRELMVTFADEDGCKQILFERRWPNGVFCPAAGTRRSIAHRAWHWQRAKCSKTGDRFSLIAGTMVENTNYPVLVQ